MKTSLDIFKRTTLDELPEHFGVWNIGRAGFPYERMIPLCECEKNYHVNMDTLKVIEMPDEEVAQAIMKAAGYRTIKKKDVVRMLNQWKIYKG